MQYSTALHEEHFDLPKRIDDDTMEALGVVGLVLMLLVLFGRNDEQTESS